jgi:CubicO group peptidase (beta-lactamase class C family)
VPRLRGTEWEGASIRDILQMESGVHWDEDTPVPAVNTQVLAWMTERVYGTTFEEVLKRKLWRPMGASGDAVMTSDRVGGVTASHGLFARPHDFTRFGELLRNRGETSDGKRVLPRRWVMAMTIERSATRNWFLMAQRCGHVSAFRSEHYRWQGCAATVSFTGALFGVRRTVGGTLDAHSCR